MMEGTTLDVDALEARAKLQLKVHRTLLKHQLIMVGNALLVGFLFAVLAMVVWLVAVGTGLARQAIIWACPALAAQPGDLMTVGLGLLVTFKVAAVLLLLCPGLGLRLCGSAMKP